MGIAEIGWVTVNWTVLAKDEDKSRDRMDALMNLEFPKCWDFLV